MDPARGERTGTPEQPLLRSVLLVPIEGFKISTHCTRHRFDSVSTKPNHGTCRGTALRKTKRKTANPFRPVPATHPQLPRCLKSKACNCMRSAGTVQQQYSSMRCWRGVSPHQVADTPMTFVSARPVVDTHIFYTLLCA